MTAPEQAVTDAAWVLHETGCSEPENHVSVSDRCPIGEDDRELARAILEAAAPAIRETERQRLLGVLAKLRDVHRCGLEYPIDHVPWTHVLSALHGKPMHSADPIADAVAAEREQHRAERDLMHADLGELLEATGLGNYARPESPHDVMQQAVARAREHAARVAELEAVAAEMYRYIDVSYVTEHLGPWPDVSQRWETIMNGQHG